MSTKSVKKTRLKNNDENAYDGKHGFEDIESVASSKVDKTEEGGENNNKKQIRYATEATQYYDEDGIKWAFNKGQILDNEDLANDNDCLPLSTCNLEWTFGHWNLMHLQFQEEFADKVKALLVSKVEECDFYVFNEWEIKESNEIHKQIRNKLEDLGYEREELKVMGGTKRRKDSEEFTQLFNSINIFYRKNGDWSKTASIAQATQGVRGAAKMMFKHKELPLSFELIVVHLTSMKGKAKKFETKNADLLKWVQKPIGITPRSKNFTVTIGDFNSDMNGEFNQKSTTPTLSINNIFGDPLLSENTMIYDLNPRCYDNILLIGDVDGEAVVLKQQQGEVLSDHHPIRGSVKYLGFDNKKNIYFENEEKEESESESDSENESESKSARESSSSEEVKKKKKTEIKKESNTTTGNISNELILNFD